MLLRRQVLVTEEYHAAIEQGAVEESNVQPVLEVTRMIDGERQFEFMTQLVQAESDRQQNAIEKLLPQQSA